MKKLLSNLKYIKMYDILSIFIFLIIVFPALVFRLFAKITKRHIWLISEDGQVARDNGYYFFKYMRTNHKNARAYFVINKKAHDYEKVKEYGNIVRFRSLKHWFYYIGAEYNISNQKNGNPAQALFYVLHVKLNFLNNRVFLQHGITKDESDWILYKNTKFRYFVCAAKREFEYIKSNFGYPENNVILTGFPRYDTLVDESAGKKQILIMPTWRNWLGRETNKLVKDENFEESDYFKNWNGLINDEEFIDFIESNDIKVKFYPHVNMEKFLGSFCSSSKNVEIVTSDTDIQEIMRQSSLMITDFSSVAMDFAYMKKPVIYFQFDQKEYREKQLKQGYYDYERDGFGPVAVTKEEVIKQLKNIYKKGAFVNAKKFAEREKQFYGEKDLKNSERVYLSLLHNDYEYVKISVVLPTLNTKDEYLKKSINSILGQTYKNFELIIVVDGGNDDEIINKNFKDDRISIIKHPKPIGIAASLNEAIQYSTGEYIIRMDADDISRKNRFKKQVKYMKKHPEVAVVATFAQKFGSSKVSACELYTKPDYIYAKSLFIAPIIHPSVAMRASVIKKGFEYSQEYERAEDYELWRRIMNNGYKIAIIKYFGLYYRVHADQVSTAKRAEQSIVLKKIYEKSLVDLHLDSSVSENLFILSGRDSLKNKRELKEFIKKVLLQNKKYKIYNQRALKKTLNLAYETTLLKHKQPFVPTLSFIHFCSSKILHKIYYLLYLKRGV